MSLLIEPPNIIFSGIRAFFTTRNLSESSNHISGNLARKLEISPDDIYLPVQKHTNIVHVLGSELEPVVADAVITSRKRILIGVVVADCVPVLLYDVKNRVVGAVHAGWRGTAAGILKDTIESMCGEFNSSPSDILAAIGPSIRQCSYEVDEKVKNEVQKATGEGVYFKRDAEKYFLDLSMANKIQALSAGLLPENIWQSEECTFCNPKKYYSYRYLKGSKGRQGGFIGIW